MFLIPETEYLALKRQQEESFVDIENQNTENQKKEKDIHIENSERMAERTIRSNEALPRHTFNTREEEETQDNLGGLINKIKELLPKKDAEKAETLVKRIFATEKMDIRNHEQVVRLKDNQYSYVQFIDLIMLCVTKKKPNNLPSVVKFGDFLSENEIPTNLIANPYIKQNMVNTASFDNAPSVKKSRPEAEPEPEPESDSDDDIDKSVSRKKGSRAMVPKLRQPFVWFQSVKDVPFDE